MARRRVNEGMTDIEELGLQLTPMIDCIFQLLIFFMVNINFRIEEGLLKAFLPKASSTPVEDDKKKEPIRVRIAEASPGVLELKVNVKVLGGRTEAESYLALEQELREIKAALGAEMPPVIIDAQPRLPYKYIISALNVCGKLSIENVMFMFPRETEGE